MGTTDKRWHIVNYRDIAEFYNRLRAEGTGRVVKSKGVDLDRVGLLVERIGEEHKVSTYILVISYDTNIDAVRAPGVFTHSNNGWAVSLETDTKVMFKQPGHKLCGLKFQGRRPNIIIIDVPIDFNDDYMRKWYYSALLPCAAQDAIIIDRRNKGALLNVQ